MSFRAADAWCIQARSTKSKSGTRNRKFQICKRRAALALLLAPTLYLWSNSNAAEYYVTNTADSGAGSLRDVIDLANSNSGQADTIHFDSSLTGHTISVSSMLPMIAKSSGGSLSIIGLGVDQLTISGTNQNRILWVESGNVVVEGLKLADGKALGGSGGDVLYGGGGGGGLGAGGAIFVNTGGSTTLRNVRLANNAAQGGEGGVYGSSGSYSGGGGGGGLHGAGGNGGDDGGGGGGGLFGNGGEGSYNGGGGGGGAAMNGGDAGFYSGGSGGGSEGGNGGNAYDFGATGAALGGGGGGARYETGGAAGDFGGGGGGGVYSAGGNGGFGGGGAGAGEQSSNFGQGGFGAGNGGQAEAGGEGGDGIGGAIFVRQGGQITLENVTFTNGTVTGGIGGVGASTTGADGQAISEGLYAMDGATTTFLIASGADVAFDSQNFQTDQIVMNNSGTLRIDNTATIGDVAVNSGTLRINANVTSDVLVNSGGVLGGNGTLIGDLIINGTLAPGNSIGAISVTGNTTFNSGSVTTIEINDGGTLHGTNHDAMNVNGNVTINGGTVNVVSAPGTYSGGSVYTFLTANNVSGNFSSITDDLAFFDAFLIYGGSTVAFELLANMSDFAPIARTKNQLAVANILDANSVNATADLQLILDELTPLTNQQVQAGLDQLGGAIYGTLPVASLQHTSYYLSQLSGQIKNQLVNSPSNQNNHASAGTASLDFVSLRKSSHETHATGWITGYGLGGQTQSDGNADGFRYGIGGTQIAVQREWIQGHSVGLWSNMSWSNVRGKKLNERADIENYHFGSYLSGKEDNHYYVLLGGLGYDHGEVQREINVGNITASPNSQFDGWQANTYLERGLTIDVNGWNVEPFTGLQYVYLRQGGSRENGGGILNLDTSGLDVHSLRSSLGGRLAKSFRFGGGKLVTPELRNSWIHEFLDTNYAVSSSFAGLAGSGFAVRGVDLGRDWASSGGSISIGYGRGSRLFAGYDAQYNTNQVLHVGSGGLEFAY